MYDILIYESGNGGEVSVKNGDVEMTDGIFNNPYLAHFGGNVEASTSGEEVENVERFDWWGNSFTETEGQMNSSMERTLNIAPLTSSGRVDIEREAKKDLDYLSELADVSCNVSITGVDKVQISDKLNQVKIDYIWDSTNNELIEEIII